MKKGQVLDSGFVVLDVVDLAELRALGIWARHEKTGAEVFHILNDDSENLFSFAFTTYPMDNTGAAHILEHMVLCGSENYPLKDAFLVLAQGSLQTFLNAWTFPDKTLYPASSVNEHDYFNLMSVYGDAVFRPLLSEWNFMQEGWRREFDDNGKLSLTGVVYNEMKGAYSSLDTYAGLWSVKSIMPGTPYEFESGGDPDCIPELTYEGLREFHRRRYSPTNCKIFLAGNIPTEKQLAFINDQFLSKLQSGDSKSGEAVPKIEKTKRWNEPRKFVIPCPAGGDSKSTVFVSWLCCDVTDTSESIALSALAEILLGHDGSPLTRALVDSGLGEDITPVSGLEGEIRETLFTAGLRGVGSNAADEFAGNGDADETEDGNFVEDDNIIGDDNDAESAGKKVEDLITDTLEKLVEHGIPAEEIEAALLSMEFSQKEIRRSGGPFSLVWMRRSLRSWLHGAKPWEGLLIDRAIAKIKENLAGNPRYFESLIQKYLLDNPHRALVILKPSRGFLSGQEDSRARQLAKIERELTANERKTIKKKSSALEKKQSEPDSPQALAAIPHLSRSDLSAEIERVPRRIEEHNGVPVLCHDIFTNSISYFDLAFPIDVLPPEDYPWLPFFSHAINSVGLPGLDYGEVSSLFAGTVGGFAAMTHSSSVPNGSAPLKFSSGVMDAGRDLIVFRLKCLDEKIAASLDLVLRVITEADFSDSRRIRDLVLEAKSEIDSGLAPSGHSYATARSGRFSSRSRQINELWGGISQLEFIHRLTETDTGEIINKLK
ncbi:MAG: insulinase family protein, partial [Treponema sp.]|nr:insulinase family protein [Treponema sp.]